MKLSLENGGVAIWPPRCHIEGMTEKKPKRPRDPNQLAKMMVDIATGEEADTPPPSERGRGVAGGKAGGAARLRVLTPERRREIASKAAKSRWKNAAHSD